MKKKQKLTYWEASKAVQPNGNRNSVYDTVTEIAKRCNVSAGEIRRHLRSGEIRGMKVGETWLTTEDAVRPFYRKRQSVAR